MKKITVLVLALLLLVLTGCGGEPKQEPKKEAAPAKAEKQTLNVYSWADYFDPEVLEAFEKENNCKVNYDVFANNEELLAKLQAGGSNYDVIMPSDYMVTAMIKLNLLDKLDPQKIPNITKLRKGLTKQSYDPTGEYSVVYTWGVTGIVYNKKFVKTPPTQWEDLWKPEYKGRVVLLNDNREVIGMALKKAGKSNNSTDPAEVKAAVDDLRKLMPNVLAFDSETIRQKFIAEEAWIGTMWSGDATFSRKDNPDLEYMIPQQGATVWADTLAIPKGTPRKALAEKFINYLYDEKVAAKNYEYIFENDPVEGSEKYHSKEYNEDPILNAATAYVGKGEWLLDIGDALRMYDQYWTELKTGH